MNELFPIELKLPSGFSYTGDFLTSAEEQQLLNFIKTMSLHPMMFQGFEAKRKVVSFGVDYSFENRKLSKGKDIPEELKWLIQKVSDYLSIPVDKFSEVLITEYPVHSVINWHRDAPPFDVVVGISLGSDCVFKLRPHDKATQSRKSIVSIAVERRSLYVISDSSRTDWQHCIAPVEHVRYSITLRTLKGSGI